MPARVMLSPARTNGKNQTVADKHVTDKSADKSTVADQHVVHRVLQTLSLAGALAEMKAPIALY